jgi:leucyl aminopeptidase
MRIRALAKPADARMPEMIGIPVFEGEDSLPSTPGLPPAPAARAALEHKDFRGTLGEAFLAYSGGGAKAIRVLLVGAGREEGFSSERLRRIAAVVHRRARSLGLRRAGVDLRPLSRRSAAAEAGRAMAEGAVLAGYEFRAFRAAENGRPSAPLEEYVAYYGGDLAAFRKGCEVGSVVAECANWARELGDLPANVVTPTFLAEKAKEAAREHGLVCRLLGPDDLRKEEMRAFLAVAQGSGEPPQLIVLEHRVAPGRRPICLVGKGLTFDSGGISIKPSSKMDEMKYDMCGGAAVLGAVRAAAALAFDVPLVAIVPATENMPGGRAQRPGDILRAKNGVTIEVLNTDAEGRLVLGDALAFAERYDPQAIVDLATLTGAVVAALGHQAAAVVGTNEELVARIREAGETSGERVWPLPLWDEFVDLVKSQVADVKNIGGDGAGAGTIVGAAFLKHFVGKTPWAHLDIAGVAWGMKARDYYERGATGFGLRLLVRLLEDWKPLAGGEDGRRSARRSSPARGRYSPRGAP